MQEARRTVMRSCSVLAAFGVLFAPARVGASPRIIPEPWPSPLGVVVREAKTIHALEVKSVDPRGVSFKVTAALKGAMAEAPFQFAEVLKGSGGCEGLFRVADPVLCFRQCDIATLFIRGRWAYAVEPIGWRGEANWFCLSTDRLDITYEGPVEALRDHVAAILAGGERTITARPPRPPGTTERGRLWRIKASLKVTRLVDSDESPHFVGWGSGDLKEAVLLANALQATEARDRVAAAEELAHLGAEVRPVPPALRRALGDTNPSVVLAAARALIRIDPEDRQGMKTLVACLKDRPAEVRADAATTLARAGLRAREALPELLRAVDDGDGRVRCAAVAALGQLAPGTGSEASALVALGARLNDSTDEGRPARAAVRALRQFGPRAWSVALQVRKAFPNLDQPNDSIGGEVVHLLARLRPPPLEFLGEVLTDHRSTYLARQAAVAHLVALGPRARRTLPRLRLALAEPRDYGVLEICQALLAIDPENAPALVAPLLLDLLRKEESMERDNALWLLGRCGPAGRPALAAVLAALQPGSFRTSEAVRRLLPLLGPEDRKLLPQLRALLANGDPNHQDPLLLADILLRLGLWDEAVVRAATGLKSESPGQRGEVAAWLGARGRQARSAEAALREPLAKATGSQRTRVALALWRVGGSGEGGSRDQAFAALEALSKLAPTWEEDDFSEALAEVHSRLRSAPDVVPLLVRALGDRNPHVRLIAGGVLACVKPEHPGTVPVLRRLLARHPDYLRYAAETLVALGPRAQSLAPLLTARLRTENDERYFDTVRVLRQIDPGFAAKGWGAAGEPGAVPEDLGPLWDDLAGSDAFRADLAIWRLAGGGPRSVALVRERLRPPPALTRERVARLISDLDSDDFETRERASSELSKSLETTVPALRVARAKNPAPEARVRLDRLLGLVDRSEDPEQRRRVRAVYLLTEVDGPEAGALLGRLASDARFTRVLEAVGARRPPSRPSGHSATREP
jgi:HEAT repeat protein